jgi:ribosome-binding protein aMBF1 (putative translation factor)
MTNLSRGGGWNSSPYGRLVRRHLIRLGMTQRDLAAKCGRHYSLINEVLAGKMKPSPHWVELMADALGLVGAERDVLHEVAAVQVGYRLSRPGLPAPSKRDAP